ncbi:MAG: glycosyltransferase family 39 protein [bacterium]|nr:glycosyltransferase family 39 protein [bacterium]
MWFDEAIVAIYARLSYLDIVRTLYDDIHQPLYYWLVKFCDSIWRDDVARKFPSLLTGVVGLGAIGWVGTRLANWRVGLVATLLLSLNASHVQFSQMLRMYTMGALFTLLASYFLYSFLSNGGNKRAMWGYILCSVLAFHTHVTNFILFIFQILFVLYCLIDYNALTYFKGYRSLSQWDVRRRLLLQLTFASALIVFGLVWTLSSRKIEFIGGFLGLAFIVNFWTVRFSSHAPPKPLISKTILVRGLQIGFWIAMLSPIFWYDLAGSFLAYYPRVGSPQTTWSPQGFSLLWDIFSSNLVRGGTLFGYSRASLYTGMMVIGALLALFQGKRWAPLFIIHGLYFYLYIYVVGYAENAISLGPRHFMATLIPQLLFAAYGMVTLLELVCYPLVGVAARAFALANRYATATWLTLLRKPYSNGLALVFVLSLLSFDLGSYRQNIQNWYDDNWADWRSFAEYLNQNLEEGTLVFFSDEGFHHHVTIYTDLKTRDRIEFATAPMQPQRKIWQALSGYEPQRAALLQNSMGFKRLYENGPPAMGFIVEKVVPVESPIIPKGGPGLWKFEGGDFNNYGFASQAYEIKSLSLRPGYLSPSIRNHWAHLIYQIEAPPELDLKDLSIHLNISVRKPSSFKVLVGTSPTDLKEIALHEQSFNSHIQLKDRLKSGEQLFVKIAVFPQWIPTDYIDALHSVMISDLDFEGHLVRKGTP